MVVGIVPCGTEDTVVLTDRQKTTSHHASIRHVLRVPLRVAEATSHKTMRSDREAAALRHRKVIETYCTAVLLAWSRATSPPAQRRAIDRMEVQAGGVEAVDVEVPMSRFGSLSLPLVHGI